MYASNQPNLWLSHRQQNQIKAPGRPFIGVTSFLCLLTGSTGFDKAAGIFSQALETNFGSELWSWFKE